MPGFRYCSWCDGKGCIACDAEEKKFTEKAIASAPKWRPGDVRDIRDAVVNAEMLRRFAGQDAMTEEEVEVAFKPALDAEYNRQFPNGPQPAFVARHDNPDDIALLRQLTHPDVLRAACENGMVMERYLDEMRATQAARKVLCPNEDDLREASEGSEPTSNP